MTKQQYDTEKKKVLEYFDKAKIVLTEQEKERIEVADFGLADLEHTALNLIIYVNTDRVCAKEMVLFPGQTCPEHRHPPFGSYPGKEETFRCRYGTVYLYVEGSDTKSPEVEIPSVGQAYYTVFHEIKLEAGEQYTISPDTKHWFTAGPKGAVVSEFSTSSYDEEDIFTNPAINRIPVIED